jgi:anti-anti-sigma regulatory factor
VFIATTDRMQDRGGTFVISNTSPVVARILAVSRLGELFGQ